MKNIVYISQIYPMKIGRQIASYGIIQEFSQYCNLEAFCSLSCRIPLEEAEKKVKNDKIHFIQEEKNDLKRRVSHPIQRAIFKWVTTIEPVNENLIKAVVNYVNSHSVDIIVIDHIALVNYLMRLKKKLPGMAFAYFSHNAESINFYQFLTGKQYPIDDMKKLTFSKKSMECKYRYFSSREKKMINNVKNVITISRSDADILSKMYNRPRKDFLATHVASRFDRVKKIESMQDFNYKILIVGAMNWYPNVRGIDWFVKNVFLPISKMDSRYKLYLVGMRPDKLIVELGEKYESIIVTGEVPSTAPYFEECDISIIPVFEGTGTKIKVLESIARGIPTISAGYSAKDYDIEDEIAIADTAEEFIHHIFAIAESASLRKQYYEKMEEFISNYYYPTRDIRKFLEVE